MEARIAGCLKAGTCIFLRGTLAVVCSFLQSPFRLHDVSATLWLYLQEEGDRIGAHFPEVLKRERWYLSSVQNVSCNISTHCRHFYILTIHWLGHLGSWNLLLCVRIYSTMLGGLTTAHLESLYPKEVSQRNSDYSWARLSEKIVPQIQWMMFRFGWDHSPARETLVWASSLNSFYKVPGNANPEVAGQKRNYCTGDSSAAASIDLQLRDFLLMLHTEIEPWLSPKEV